MDLTHSDVSCKLGGPKRQPHECERRDARHSPKNFSDPRVANSGRLPLILDGFSVHTVWLLEVQARIFRCGGDMRL